MAREMAEKSSTKALKLEDATNAIAQTMPVHAPLWCLKRTHLFEALCSKDKPQLRRGTQAT